MADALFEHLLGVIGVLGDPVLGRSRLGEVAQQRRKSFEGLARQLDLAPREGLHAFGGQLVGLAERLDIAALRRPDRLDIKRPEAEIGEHLGHVEIEEVGTSIRHGAVPIRGCEFCAVHNRLYRLGPVSRQARISQRNNFR